MVDVIIFVLIKFLSSDVHVTLAIDCTMKDVVQVNLSTDLNF